MGKLKLNLDEIKVESFVTNESQKMLGTVQGQNLWASDAENACVSQMALGNECIDDGGTGGSGGFSKNVICTGNYAATCGGYSCNEASCGGTCNNCTVPPLYTCHGSCMGTCPPTFAEYNTDCGCSVLGLFCEITTTIDVF